MRMNGIASPLQVDDRSARMSVCATCVTSTSYIGDGRFSVSRATDYSSNGNASCWSSSSIVDS